MFAYIVKRLISGVLVLTLVSMAIFLLFWYGPTSPARPICDRETSNRCTPGASRRYSEHARSTTTPSTSEYGKFVQGHLRRAATSRSAPTTYECAAPCLGLSYNTKQPGQRGDGRALPATFSVAIGGAFLYLLLGIPIGVAAARRRGT